MTHAQTIAEDILAFLVSKMPITPGTREDITKYVTRKIEPFAPEPQYALTFKDAGDFKGQAAAILKLLKKARSQGVMNHELMQDGRLNYRARISELRKEGYRIHAERVGPGRVYRYILQPESW